MEAHTRILKMMTLCIIWEDSSLPWSLSGVIKNRRLCCNCLHSISVISKKVRSPSLSAQIAPHGFAWSWFVGQKNWNSRSASLAKRPPSFSSQFACIVWRLLTDAVHSCHSPRPELSANHRRLGLGAKKLIYSARRRWANQTKKGPCSASILLPESDARLWIK